MNEKSELKPGVLPPEAQEIIRRKKIRAKKRPGGWRILLKTLAMFDEATDEEYSSATGKVGTSLIIAFLSLMATIFGAAFTDGNMFVVAIGGIVALFGIVRLIINGVKAFRLKKLDLSNDFRETLLPLFDILDGDIKPKGKVLIDLDFSGGTDKEHEVSKQKVPPGIFRKLIETIYEINICNAEIPLVNETVLKLGIAKRFISYDRYYRNSRGKHKHKKKWKLLTTVSTEVLPSSGEFDISEDRVTQLADREKIRLKEKNGDRLCRLTRRFKFKSADGSRPEDSVPPEAIIDMYMQICSALKA